MTTTLKANLDAVGLLLQAIPAGKILNALEKALKKYADKLNPLVKKLRKFDKSVTDASHAVEKAAADLSETRAKLAELQHSITGIKADIKAATSQAERDRLTKELNKLVKRQKLTEGVEKVYVRDRQDALDKLHKVKAEEAKVSRKVDAVLKKVRKALDKFDELKKDIDKGIDDYVDNIHPGWAREVVQEAVKRLREPVDNVLGTVESKVKHLTAAKLEEILNSNKATSGILSFLKATYDNGISAITKIKIPVWDGDLSVSFDQAGSPSVAGTTRPATSYSLSKPSRSSTRPRARMVEGDADF